MEKTMGISRTGGGGDGDGANTFEQIQSLSRLQRLAELDFRFNTFNARFYAPQSAADPLGMHGHCAGASGGVGNGENPLVSPVLPSGGGGGGSNQLPGLVADSQSTGLNEESWRARDIVYVRQLKMSSTGRQLLNQRERYRARICELFPNIRVLDGMPVLTHGEKR
ncbi:hypothetical protein EV182_000793 [Spiromyces aspiralis]|uniref:Uncharacterized protein n=1 Tax=Spiromyces aspiralis TaxID=68401 RepID=A0ACC1HUU1_9FUNG|nr:hypothetical protein EV182_000793 [Spiromyces aspiralis]